MCLYYTYSVFEIAELSSGIKRIVSVQICSTAQIFKSWKMPSVQWEAQRYADRASLVVPFGIQV